MPLATFGSERLPPAAFCSSSAVLPSLVLFSVLPPTPRAVLARRGLTLLTLISRWPLLTGTKIYMTGSSVLVARGLLTPSLQKSIAMSAASGSSHGPSGTDGSWCHLGKDKLSELAWSVDSMTSRTPKPDSEHNFERIKPQEEWRQPQPRNRLDQRPLTPERRTTPPMAAEPQRQCYSGGPPTGSRCVPPLGVSQQECVEGERVRCEHDRQGNTYTITESRKRVSASTTAAVTPSRETQGRVLDYIVREGHVSNAVKAQETIVQRAKDAQTIDKLDAKTRRRASRLLGRSARAASAQGSSAQAESEARAKASDALDKMSAEIRERGLFDKYGTIPLEGELYEQTSDDDIGEVIGDCVYEASSDSGYDFPSGEARTKTGRTSQRRRYKKAKHSAATLPFGGR